MPSALDKEYACDLIFLKGAHLQLQQEERYLEMQNTSGFDVDGCLRDRYSLRRLLGSGSSSEVVEALDTQTNMVVAIKKLTYPIQPRRVLREIHILTKLDHKNIIKLIDVRYTKHKTLKT